MLASEMKKMSLYTTTPRCLAALSVGLLLAATGAAADWPQWSGPKRDRISQEELRWPSSEPKRLWEVSVGWGYSGVAVSGGRIYTMGNNGQDVSIGKWKSQRDPDAVDDKDTVWCLDEKTGEVIWKYEYLAKNGSPTYPGPRATPTVDGDLVYTVSYDGQLKALKAATGELVWEADFPKDFGAKITKYNRHGWCCSPLVVGDMLIVHPGTKGASVVAYNKKTGKVIWKSGDDLASFSSPVLYDRDGHRKILILSATGLFAYALADGKPLWNVPWENGAPLNSTDPLILADGRIFVTAANNGIPGNEGEGSFLVEIAKDGTAKTVYERTDKDTIASQCGTPVLVDGYIYGPTGRINSARLRCVDPATGEVLWRNDAVQGDLIAAGKHLVIQSLKGDIIVVEASPKEYKEVARFPVLTGECWTPPTLANGRLYCRNTEGDLVCIDLGTGK